VNRDDIRTFGAEFIKQFQEDDASGMAAELAYRWLFAVFPFGIFLAALGSFVASWVGIENPAQRIVDAVGDNLPAELASGIQPELERVIGQHQPGIVSIGALLALWAATSGTMTVIKAMNRAYGVEETRSAITRYGIGIGLTIGAAAGLLIAFVTIVGGSLLTEQVAEQVGLGSGAWSIITIARWPVVFALLVLAVSVVLRFGPNMAPSWKSTLAGGAIFAVGWLIATIGFALYVSNVANYGATYGALASVIILMLWFYVTAMILVGAGELVALITKRTEPERLAERRESIRADIDLKEAAGAITHKVDDVKRTLSPEGDTEPAAQKPVPAWDPASLPPRLASASRNELPDGVILVALAVIGASVAFLTSRISRR
jgi:membrane protein